MRKTIMFFFKKMVILYFFFCISSCVFIPRSSLKNEMKKPISTVEIKMEIFSKDQRKNFLFETKNKEVFSKIQHLYGNKKYYKTKEKKVYYYTVNIIINYTDNDHAVLKIFKDKGAKFYAIMYKSNNSFFPHYGSYLDPDKNVEELVRIVKDNNELN